MSRNDLRADLDPLFYALIDYEDAYVQPLTLAAFKSLLPPSSFKLINSLSECPSPETPVLQFRAYESLDFEHALENSKSLINAYVIRKALIRKHYLSTTVSNWIVKHPTSVLKDHFKPAVDFELDYAEFLDDALVEAFELRASFEQNEGKGPSERQWWILKPGMSDRGQGIRLFSTEAELQSIFKDWEIDEPSDDDEDARSTSPTDMNVGSNAEKDSSDYIITSQLRHFVAQPYIHPPLLLPSFQNRKFHIRTYVLAVGALSVYVYKPMLALFATEPYRAPGEDINLKAHLTNTCLQETGEREGSVRAFWDLEDTIPGLESFKSSAPAQPSTWKEAVFSQICATTGEVFEAAARGMMVHFQPLPGAFELYGLDFLVDAEGTAWLLEVNAFPDFRQTGDDLQGVVQGLFEEVVHVAVKPFFDIEGGKEEGSERMVKVLDIDLGRR
ncbi:TTL-domain-containing protein [Tothia fuscella]|uniref:TTL-domain-containing protein n=1 Tax=Tothia fuscella TaxID=1048955 RepID=A0A9P4NWM9_9PEZI|nr:TTL-domain-containing protein [Tothia fuscella]